MYDDDENTKYKKARHPAHPWTSPPTETWTQTFHASPSLTVLSHLPAEPACDSCLILLRSLRGLPGTIAFGGRKRRGSFKSPASVKQIDCLASFSRRRQCRMDKWVGADAAGSACFEFIDRTNSLVHLYGSEHTAFPEIGIKGCTCCASCTHMCWWACTFPSRAWFLCMVRYPGETQRPSVPGRTPRRASRNPVTHSSVNAQVSQLYDGAHELVVGVAQRCRPRPSCPHNVALHFAEYLAVALALAFLLTLAIAIANPISIVIAQRGLW